MSQLLALEWNGREARLVVAALRGDEAVIEEAFSVGLEPRQASEELLDVDVGERIASALAARGIGRIDTVVAVGRSNIELRQLSLPPAPEEELPDMVRFQAMREFNELDENWLLDFVPISESSEGPQSVLAAAIDPGTVKQIEQTCQTAHLKPRRLILRPCAAASLLGRSPTAETSRPTLLVDLLSDEADLTVMIDRKVIFLRTTRLSGDPLEDAKHLPSLLGEVRRTIAAAQNQLGGRRIESIVLCGRDEQHAALGNLIEAQLSIPTELFDPFEGLSLGRRVQRELPEHPGRFAPLLGMALAELEETPHAIDFLHPRRPPEPPKRQARYVLAGVLVAVLVLAFFGYRRWERSWLEREVGNLSAQLESLEKLIDHGNKAKAAVDEVERWAATDVVWLDELGELSGDFQPAKEAMLTKLSLVAAAPGGKMELEGLVREAPTIDVLEQGLRDEKHHVQGTGSGAESNNEDYSWWFKSSVVVDREAQ